MICKIQNCGKRVLAKGLCSMHYSRLRRDGEIGDSQSVYGAPLSFLFAALKSETDECIIWPFCRNHRGYGHLTVDNEHVAAHRFICEKVNGSSTQETNWALHSCGRGEDGCINPRHIKWGSAKQNAKDRDLHGTSNKGERQGNVKITEVECKKIKQLLLNGLSVSEISVKLEISKPIIYGIKSGKTWSWLS